MHQHFRRFDPKEHSRQEVYGKVGTDVRLQTVVGQMIDRVSNRVMEVAGTKEVMLPALRTNSGTPQRRVT